MKIGIITFHASHNHGSMLQAWAMQNYLQKKGHKVEIINYRSFQQKKLFFQPFELNNKYSFQSSLKRLFLSPFSFKSFKKKWQLFESFLNSEYNLTKEYNTIEQLYDENFDYDLVVVGSDQIWNTDGLGSGECTEAYFANFVSCKKIAYAPSFGPDITHVNKDFIKKHLRNFSGLSVRESSGKSFLLDNKLVNSVEVVCDPTLLLEGEDYFQLIESRPLYNEDYIFFYSPHALPIRHFEIVNKIGQQLGIPVIADRLYYPKDIKKFSHIKIFPEVGPKEFLNLIKNAQLVVGESFHLLVFSLLLKKSFFCINGDLDNRLSNLLSAVGMQRRAINVKAGELNDDYTIKDFSSAMNFLDSFRQHSYEYLNQFIS